ncbi:conserved hypothetical protein [Leishmania major strain Friedlin]|uniref:Uncharacterized protein n=1 Tax=Leishmania major TaxID=5664 RepID=Q4QBR7_LEIMA|nr:conserved hypothetical protein [Leishmania major strain Friedlin]CAJ04313.1 conserved hypothetical protein [Leishmania major strain Friedlin]|eukprot:XP_001683231.1 conserved hypothetical protein [Leishmania major strain Friedlin]
MSVNDVSHKREKYEGHLRDLILLLFAQPVKRGFCSESKRALAVLVCGFSVVEVSPSGNHAPREQDHLWLMGRLLALCNHLAHSVFMPKHPVKHTTLQLLEGVANPAEPLSFTVLFDFSTCNGLRFCLRSFSLWHLVSLTMQPPKTECQMQQEQSDELFARQLQEQLNSSHGVVDVPPPQSGPSKSVQEAADAAYARQLQQEIDLQEAATDVGASRASDEDKIPVECPACTFVNYMKPSRSSKHWKCAQCSGPLMENASHSSPVSHKDLVECRVCHSLNKLPSTKSDVVLCGGCYQELGLPLSSASPVESEENQRTVQLRCGQCSVINAVTVGAKVKRLEFICGGCGVLNTMTLE